MPMTHDADEPRSGEPPRSAAQIEAWLIGYMAELLKLDREQIDVTKSFEAYGLDSAAAVGLTGDLEVSLGLEVDPTLPYDYPTIAALAQRLAEMRQ